MINISKQVDRIGLALERIAETLLQAKRDPGEWVDGPHFGAATKTPAPNGLLTRLPPGLTLEQLSALSVAAADYVKAAEKPLRGRHGAGVKHAHAARLARAQLLRGAIFAISEMLEPGRPHGFTFKDPFAKIAKGAAALRGR